jgi:hypothetical protein
MASDEQMQRLASELETVSRQLGNIEDTLDRMTGYLERIAVALEARNP